MTYICASCKGEFEQVNNENWNDEMAREEMRRNLGRDPRPDDAVVCDDCYQAMQGRVSRVRRALVN